MGRRKKDTGKDGLLDNGRRNRGNFPLIPSDSPKCDNITEDDYAFIDEVREMTEEFN